MFTSILRAGETCLVVNAVYMKRIHYELKDKRNMNKKEVDSYRAVNAILRTRLVYFKIKVAGSDSYCWFF